MTFSTATPVTGKQLPALFHTTRHTYRMPELQTSKLSSFLANICPSLDLLHNNSGHNITETADNNNTKQSAQHPPR
jgi:hypothetical protein